jgi:hypothetical protein
MWHGKLSSLVLTYPYKVCQWYWWYIFFSNLQCCKRMQTQNVHFSLWQEKRCESYGTKQDGNKGILELKWCKGEPWSNSIQKTCHGPSLKTGTTFFLILYFTCSHNDYIQMANFQIFPNSKIIWNYKLWIIISWACNFFILHPNRKLSIIIVWSHIYIYIYIYIFTLMYQYIHSKLILPFKMPFKWLNFFLIIWLPTFQMAITFITSYHFWNATPCYYITFQKPFNDLKKARFGQGLSK